MVAFCLPNESVPSGYSKGAMAIWPDFRFSNFGISSAVVRISVDYISTHSFGQYAFQILSFGLKIHRFLV